MWWFLVSMAASEVDDPTAWRVVVFTLSTSAKVKIWQDDFLTMIASAVHPTCSPQRRVTSLKT